MLRKVKSLIKDDDVSFGEFYNALYASGVGDWDWVSSRDALKDYICNMVQRGVAVSHILQVLEDDPYESTDCYKMWLGDSLDTPVPITTKDGLAFALDLDGSESVDYNE